MILQCLHYNDNLLHKILINERTYKDQVWNYFNAIINDIVQFNITFAIQCTVYTDSIYIHVHYTVLAQSVCIGCGRVLESEGGAIRYTYTYVYSSVAWCLPCTCMSEWDTCTSVVGIRLLIENT